MSYGKTQKKTHNQKAEKISFLDKWRKRELAAHRKALAVAEAQQRVARAKKAVQVELEKLRKIKNQPLEKFER